MSASEDQFDWLKDDKYESKFKKNSEKMTQMLQKRVKDGKPPLHSYQVEAVLKTGKMIKEDITAKMDTDDHGVIKPVIIWAPTGAGKSGMIVLLPYVLSSDKVLVLTPSKVISEQLAIDFGYRKDRKCFFENIGMVKNDKDGKDILKLLLEDEPLIDPNKTSIWGGYATTKVLETDTQQVFKCGISVSSVSSWQYYDSIYTERYMSLPTEQDNLKGYYDSDVVSKEHVENLRNKTFLLVHGTADDNVHYQQSMILARSLEQNDISFHQLSYPDVNHGISMSDVRLHFYHSLERFLFDECYKTSNKDETPTTRTQENESSSSVIPNNPIFIVTFSTIVIMARCAF